MATTAVILGLIVVFGGAIYLYRQNNKEMKRNKRRRK